MPSEPGCSKSPSLPDSTIGLLPSLCSLRRPPRGHRLPSRSFTANRSINTSAPCYDEAVLIHSSGTSVPTSPYGEFGTHWATRIFIEPSRQNCSSRPPAGKYSGQVGEDFVLRVRQFMRLSPSWRKTCQKIDIGGNVSE